MQKVFNKNYFVAQINSSKAYKFTSYYHYSRQGFKKAQINLGIFRNDNQKLVGVLQWGISAAEDIRLDRYVKEPITKNEYLELNRFCMDDEEGKNSESSAISLGIKWIRKFRKDIRLLVSYSGRKEGNYGYIYQATNWEYLGYFISPGFWLIDGIEKHMITLSIYQKRHCDRTIPLKDALCKDYRDVRQTWTKQFIYIQRLDQNLTVASDVLPYPKPQTEFPIKTKEEVYKSDESLLDSPIPRNGNKPNYFYVEDEPLFLKRTLIRRGDLIPKEYVYVQYDRDGNFCNEYSELKDIKIDGYDISGIYKALKSKDGKYKDFRFFKHEKGTDYPKKINGTAICEIDGKMFYQPKDVADYIQSSKQMISIAKKTKTSVVKGKKINWF